MPGLSKIEWTDFTLNPIVGCSPISVGCQNCYARSMAQRQAAMGREQYQKVKAWDGTVHYMGREWFEEKVKAIPKGKRVFVCSMGDIFHENVKPEWRKELFEVMASRPDVDFQILTKRSGNIDIKCLPNVMMGVTAEDQYREWERTEELLKRWKGRTFVSHEPLLGDIYDIYDGIDLRIVGGETGQNYRIRDDGVIVGQDVEKEEAMLIWFNWAWEIFELHAGAKFFKKPPGGGMIGEDGFTTNTPEDLKIREFPDNSSYERRIL